MQPTETRATVFIATPAYEGKVNLSYHRSCTRALLQLGQQGIKLLMFAREGDGLIGRTRSMMVSYFLANPEKPTHLMFIDSDIGFDPQDIVRMIDTGHDFVTASYRKRQPEELYSVKPLSYTKPVNGCIEVQYNTTGFMMLSRQCILKLIANYPERRCMIGTGGWYTAENQFAYDLFPCPIDRQGMFLSEDYGICDLWRRIGGKVYLLPDVTLSHTGPCDFRGSIANTDFFQFHEEPDAAGVAA